MYGRGNPGSQFGQSFQSAVRHPYQQHVPPQFIPPSSGQSQAGTYPGPLPASGQFGQTGIPTYEHMPRPPPNLTNQPYVHAPLPLPPPPPIHGALQMPRAYLNVQQNAPNTAYAGNQNLHHIPTPLPPRVVPPPQGQTTYWSQANFQTLPVGAHVPLPSVPSSDTSGSTSSATPGMGENPMSLVSLPPPPPPPTSPPPMQPSPPASSLHTTLSSQMHIQDTGKAADPKGENLEPLEDIEAQNAAENEFSRHGDTIIREDKGTNMVNSQVGDSFVLDKSMVSDPPPPPIKPKEERVIQRIEVLCHFIAKNGPGFEEMARQKESENPEFKFLFGGEPGSEAAIAHEYFQWLKKKCNMESKSQEESIVSSSRHLKEDSVVHHAQSMATASMDIHSDSDMEMEDDITHADKDTGMGRSSDVLSQVDDKEELAVPQNVQICAPPSGLASEKFLCSGKTDLDGQVIKNGSPFRLIQDYSSDESSDIDDKTLPREEDTESVRPTTVGSAPPAGSGDNKSKFETNLGSIIVVEGEKDSGALPECNLKAATNSFESRREVQMTAPKTLASGLCGKTSEEDNDKKESIPDALSSEAFQVERGRMSSFDNIGERERSGKENAEYIEEPASASLKVDEFGRLLRDKTDDSDSDDSRSAERYNRKGKYRRRSRSRSWSHSRSPVDRRSRQKRRDRRSTSRSWSPRKRRSRSRSPVSRRLHEFRHDNIRRDKSRMPECFDFLRGKCYRGASCRYWHHDADLDRSRHQQRKRQNLEASSVQEKFDSNEEKDLSQRHSNFRDHDVKVKASEKMPGKILSSAKDQNSEHPLIDTEQVSVVNVHDLSDDDKKIPSQKDKRMVQEGFLDSSSRSTNAKSSQGMENHQPLSIGWTDQPVANAGTQSLRDAQHNSSQPSVHLPPTMQGESAQNFHQPTSDTNMPLASSYAPQSANGEGLSSNALSSSQQFLFPAPQVSWSSMPPQSVPPIHLASSGGDATTNVYNDHQPMPYATPLRPYSTERPTHSYVGQFQHQASNLTQNPSRPQMYTADYRIGTLPGNNLQNQPIGGPGLMGELHSRGIQSYSSGSLPSAGSLQSSSQTYFYPQQQNLSSGLHYGKATNNLDMATSISSALLQIPDKNPTSHVPDFGGSRLSTHYNPYASTFEQPLSSKFTSDTTMQDLRNRYNTLSQLVHGPMGQATSSPRAAAAISQNIPPSHDDQYDPLFDCIEPSLNSEKRSDHAPHIGLNKPLDVEKDNKNKEIGSFSPSTSLDDDGFGETAEAEVGAVENASPSGPADLANSPGNDIEIDQVKSPDKNKKRKDSRSMKLFKVALADFVKEVLRPSWRQGNMSKEAFKTIVKKTVDKVTGSMKGRRIPKSQSKINHYIDSSQRKLTKLVMGYVDKYVKV